MERAWSPHHPVRHFCESVHSAPGTPEYFAAVSSLIISALALVSLFAGEWGPLSIRA